MASTPTNHSRLEQQGLGENLNTWGDDKLNRVLRKIDQMAKAVLSLTLTGNHTLATALYDETADEAAYAVLKLGGTPAGAVTLTLPSVAYWYWVANAAGAAVTVKTAAGSGVALPTGTLSPIYCDGTDVLSLAPTYIGARLQGVSTPTAGTDAANRTYVDAGDATQQAYTDAAIAAAALPATAGTVRISADDTTARFLGTALVAGTDITLTETGDGADETLTVAVTGETLLATALALRLA